MANKTISNSYPVSQDIQQEILRAVISIEYGSVESMIHDGQVVQTKCRERIRIYHTDSIRSIK